MNSNADTALLNAFLEAAVDAIVVSDSSAVITRVNSAAEKLYGYPSEELVGQSLNILMPESFASQHDGYMKHHLETGETRIIDIGREVAGLRKDGSVFPLHLSVGRAEADGQTIFVGIMHNLSTRHATQAALERSQRLDAIGQMTGGISHDFNNLLTVVIGNLEILDTQITNMKQRDLLKDALEAAELGADLTSNLMAFSRKGELKPVVLDINEACKSTLSLLKRMMGTEYSTKTDFANDIDKIMVDPTQLQAAFLNICLNAKDAMPDGGSIQIATENFEIDDQYIAQEIDVEQGSYVRISISDNGCGMPAKTQARALEPFFTTKPAGHGTGLGLAMVYGFVRQSGGHITIYSELDQGTTISLYFPKASSAHIAPSPAAVGSQLGHGQVVLVVEDNPKVRELSVMRVNALGYETLGAASGDQAFDILKTRSDILVVFTDVVMPGELNGFALVEKVQAEFPKVKVLITSGYTEDVFSKSSTQETEAEILRKPYRQQELAKRLQALLEPD